MQHSTLATPRSMRRARVVAATLATGALIASGLGVGAGAAVAAVGDTTLNVEVAQTTGTAPWDALDTTNADSVVRTNDTISYVVSVRNENSLPGGGGGQATNPTISFDLPRGQELVSLPALCLQPGSSVSPATLGTLPLPLTGTSWLAFPVQAITCRVADRTTTSSTLDYTFLAKVRGEVPDGAATNGTTMLPFTATATADEFPAGDTSSALPIEIAAEAKYDLSKNGTSSLDDNSGHVPVRTEVCANPAYAAAGYVGCKTMLFPIQISVQAGGKGSTPLASPISFVDDISPDTLWGAGTTAKPGYTPSLAPSVVGCGQISSLDNGASFYPYGAMAGRSSTNSVRDSGTFSCVQTGGIVAVTITNTDTTANSYPATNGTSNVTMPVDRAYIVSGWIKIEFPVAAAAALGTTVGTTSTLPYENTFTGLSATDIAGNPLAAEPTANNSHGGSVADSVPGGSYAKYFAGEPGNPANSGGSGYAAGNLAGPPGSSDGGDGAGIVQAGSRIVSLLVRGTSSPPGYGAANNVMCDSWDNSKAALTAANWRGMEPGPDSAPFGTAGYLQYLPSNGAAVWLSSMTSTTAYSVQYSGGVGSQGAANGCLESSTGWSDTPGEVVGNDAALAATGVYTAVGQVRILYTMDSTLTTDTGLQVAASIGLTVLDTVASGDIIGNWASAKTLYGAGATVPSNADTIAAIGVVRALSTYNPSPESGQLGDRVSVQEATARLLKNVWNPVTGSFVNSGIPVYTTGDTTRYRLTPSVTAGTTSGATTTAYLEDCLPAYLSFVEATRDGAAFAPEVVSAGSPAGATLACAVGSTYVRWNLGAVVINQALSPIEYTATLIETAPNGVLTNTAMISAVGDTSAPIRRTATAQIQIVTPTGIKLAKTTVTPTIEVNPDGAAFPRTAAWNVQFAVIDTSGVSNADVIDVLPANGMNGNDFTGSLLFGSAVASSSGAGTPSLSYTSAPAASLVGDPKAASNLPAGGTVWCDAVAGGAVVSGVGSACPASAAEVTGVRMRLAGSAPAGTVLNVAITMIPQGNADGDVYTNQATANADGVLQGVGPVARAIAVIASSIGDYVWLDANADGLQDETEVGVAGVPVTLSGIDSDGNTVAATTVTDADGGYLFASLPSGTYTVVFDAAWVAANSYRFTLRLAGDDTGIDSDADLVTGSSGEIELGVEQDRVDIDAGLVVVPVVPVDPADPEIPVVPDTPVPATPATPASLASTGTNLLVGLSLSALLFLTAAGVLLLARRRARSA